MERKVINRSLYDFLKQELGLYKERSIISPQQEEDILNLYQVKQKVGFTTIVLIIGAVLMGLGVLSFIASNWPELDKFAKFGIILAGFLITDIVSYFLSENYPKTSRSLLYLGILIFGAGIFLIGQAFNLGGHFSTAFMWWGVGALVTAVLFRDLLAFTFADILFIVYLNGSFDLSEKVPYAIFLIIPAVYYLNKFLGYSRLITFINNIIALNTILYFAIRYEWGTTYAFFLFFVIGLLMYFANIKFQRNIFKIQGNLVFGIAGLGLTVSDVWQDLYMKLYGVSQIDLYKYDYEIFTKPASIIFAICFVIFLLFLTKKGSLTSLVFICLTIFKFYFDTAYDFMPKSMFFMIGGLMLVGFGYYIERTRKRLGGIEND